MTAKLDPITLELIHSKVTSVIEEMRIVLFHSGYSTVLARIGRRQRRPVGRALAHGVGVEEAAAPFRLLRGGGRSSDANITGWKTSKTAMSSSSIIPMPAT